MQIANQPIIHRKLRIGPTQLHESLHDIQYLSLDKGYFSVMVQTTLLLYQDDHVRQHICSGYFGHGKLSQ